MNKEYYVNILKERLWDTVDKYFGDLDKIQAQKVNKINIDPAAATGPFVTTGIDLVAILIYFSTCRIIIP